MSGCFMGELTATRSAVPAIHQRAVQHCQTDKTHIQSASALLAILNIS